ncbi:reverse transcriptase domain-containing protein, partial [Tanacetum coccineum]
HISNQGIGQGNGRNQNGDAVNDNIRGDVSRGCTYKEFLACNPKEYDGKGGAIVYTCWIEKMESVQDMSGFRDSQKVKYTAGLFVCKPLSWWNSQIHIRGQEAVVGMSWEDFKTLTREEFFPSNEMQKLETELWNYAMVGAGHAACTDRFHELARLVPHFVTPKYVAHKFCYFFDYESCLKKKRYKKKIIWMNYDSKDGGIKPRFRMYYLKDREREGRKIAG